MPNQLARSKRRQSLAEHEDVLTALADCCPGTTGGGKEGKEAS